MMKSLLQETKKTNDVFMSTTYAPRVSNSKRVATISLLYSSYCSTIHALSPNPPHTRFMSPSRLSNHNFPPVLSAFISINPSQRMSKCTSKLSATANGFKDFDFVDDDLFKKTNGVHSKSKDFSHIERIFAISDLHTDDVTNLSWLKDRCGEMARSENPDNTPGSNDILLIAGDISHEFSVLKETFDIITDHLQCTVFFVPGNHEAWIGGTEMNEKGITNSIQKLDLVQEMCSNMEHVQVHPHLVGAKYKTPVWLVPIQGWYDGTLTLPNCEDLCNDFASFPWVDFTRCTWPQTQFPPYGKHHIHGKIPQGLVDYFIEENESILSPVRSSFSVNSTSSTPGLITFSHFLPTQKVLPDWKDVHSNIFSKDEWLDHGAGGISAKFAKVAGSSLLDDQIRSISSTEISSNSNQNACHNGDDHHAQKKQRHLHVFGHSHRPKDVTINNVRYIHNPLGKPGERELQMVNPKVDFQLIWDCCSENGEVAAKEEIIRYWEEKGGGKKALKENMERRRRKRREALKVIMEKD